MRKACEDEEAITKIIIAAVHRSIDRVVAFFIVVSSPLSHYLESDAEAVDRVEIFAPVALGGNISCHPPILIKEQRS